MAHRTTHRHRPDPGRRRQHGERSSAERSADRRSGAVGSGGDGSVAPWTTTGAREFWSRSDRRSVGDRRPAIALAAAVGILVVVSAAWSVVSDGDGVDRVAVIASDPVATTAKPAAGDATAAPGATETASAESVVATETITATAAGPTAGSTTDATAATCRLRYEVHPGDFWIRLADESGVALAELLSANSATVETPLHPGQTICFPRGARVPSPPPTVPATTVPPTTGPAPAPARPRPTRPVAVAAPSTTTAPARPATPSAPPAPTASNESPAEVEALIRSVWPADLADRAVEIARRESRLRPGAYNGHCCYGVFQIHWGAHRSWLDDHGVTRPEHLLDARTNITMAYRIYQRAGGWGPWRLASDG